MFSKILVPIDLAHEPINEKVLDISLEMAAQHDAEIHVMTVVPTYSMSIVGSFFPAEHEQQALDAVKEKLKEFLEKRQTPEKGLKGHVAQGTIYDEIMKAADKLQCDLIVMASNRPDLQDYLLGPNAARVVRHANQSVFVLRIPESDRA